MNKLLFILSILLLTSCEYDYIHENPNHPQEYIGNWLCDSISPKGQEFRNFSIMQTGVDVTLNARTIARYPNWKVNEQQTTLSLLNYDNIEVLTCEIIEKPYKLVLKLDNITYYLHHE